nr:C-type mannose receptor 2-like [Misgurnus anguillicaudatus]
MNMNLFVLFLLSGLLCSASGLWREYQYINISMSWTEAQSYCREIYTDLATVDSMDDVNRMMKKVNDGYRGSVWIGLQTANQKRWVWSNGEDNISYNQWAPEEPFGSGDCVILYSNASYDYPCETPLSSVCYNESNGYVIINDVKNWTDAQSYCRQYHTDLAFVHNSREQLQLYAAVVDFWKWAWIGLFLDSWQWSDQWNLAFRNWAPGQQFQRLGDCVAMSTTDSGKWVQYSCDQKYHFICHGVDKLVQKQTVRLKLSNDGKHNLTDPLLQTAIMNEINIKLKNLGVENTQIKWRKDEDGEVFHLSKRTVNSRPPCNMNP